jgi:hypothetical protein
MDSPVSVNSSQFHPKRSYPTLNPVYLDYLIPASLMMEIVPGEFEKKFIRVEKETYNFSSPIGDLFSDNGGDNFVDVLVPETLAQEIVGRCVTLGEIIQQLQNIDPEEKAVREEIIHYFVEIAKHMHITDYEPLRVYLSKLNPPIEVQFPAQTPPVTVPAARVGSFASRHFPSFRQEAEVPATSHYRPKRHRCTIL